MDYIIEIKRSRRRSIGFEIKSSGVLTVRAPYRITEQEIMQRVQAHRQWIEKHMLIVQNRERLAAQLPDFSEEDIRQMAEEALEKIPQKVEQYARQIGVTYGRITIRNQKTRWGSCSVEGNLNFNCLLMQVPEQVMDYVIVHELCHRKEMNHSKRFWQLVEQVMPDYTEHKKWLKEHGQALICRMRQ